MGAIVFVVALLALCSCAGGGSPLAESYYELAGFSQEDGRYSYEGGEGLAAKTGVDVSENQGFIDWDAVAADDVDFALVRIGYRGTTEGGLYQDAYFDYNIGAARDAGLECGVYFFSQAVSAEEAEEEAAFVLALLDGRDLEYPVMFDHERQAPGIASRVGDLTEQEATAAAVAFCESVERGGYEVAVYGNSYDLARYDLSALSGHPLWYAEYGDLPAYERPFIIWQYANDGAVAGIDTVVDLNLDMRP